MESLKDVSADHERILLSHQKMLESILSKERQNNIIITGVAETEEEDVKTVQTIFTHIKPDYIDNVETIEMDIERIGDVEIARKPRPLKVNVKRSKLRNEICANARKLKGKEGYDEIYVKKDTHPAIRTENARIYKLIKEEKGKPINEGCNFFFDWKNRVVTKDGLVIDKFNPIF